MKHIKLVLGMVLLTGLMSCSRSLVRSDYDQHVNFAALRTFDWKSESQYAGSASLAKNSLFEKRLKESVENELSARSLTKQASNPDFLITFSVDVNDKVEVRSDRTGYPYGYYGYYGYWPGYYRFSYRSRYYGLGYGPGFYDHSATDVYQYKEATLLLDFVDPASGELLWRGIYIAEIDESGIITEKKINEAVRDILKKFPPENSRGNATNLITSNKQSPSTPVTSS